MGDNNCRYIGRHVSRADGRELTSGRRQFIDDVRIPGILTTRVLGSPYSHVNIVGVRVERVEALVGVKAVPTCKDTPDWECGLSQYRRMLDHRVRFTGDSVALVTVETLEAVDEACELTEVEYEELPFVSDCEEAIKSETPQFYEEFPGNVLPKVTPFSEEPSNQIHAGDVEKASEKAAYVVGGYYCYDKLPHPLPPGSPGMIAQWTSPDAITLYYNGGTPHLQKLNTETSTPGVMVRAIACYSGGSYGNKQLIPHLALQAVVPTRETGRVVKLMMGRTDHMLSHELRQGNRIRGKVGTVEGGVVSTMQGMQYTDPGMPSTHVQAMTVIGPGKVQAFYGKCKNWDLDTMLTAINHNSQAPIRGFGNQESKGALTPPVCTAIRATRMGPCEVFRKNFAKAEDLYIWRDYK